MERVRTRPGAGLLLGGAGALAVLLAIALGAGALLPGRPVSPPVPAPTATPEPLPPAAGRVGEWVAFVGDAGESGALRVNSFRWTRDGAIPPGRSYLVVDVSLRAAEPWRPGEPAGPPVRYNAFRFEVDDGSATPNTVAFSSDAAPRLTQGTLRAGEQVRGFVDFDLEQQPVVQLWLVTEAWVPIAAVELS